MNDLLTALSPSTAVIATGIGVVLFVLKVVSQNKADTEWIAWRGVLQTARAVKYSGVPYEELVAEINAVQERFNSRDTGTSLLEILALRKSS